MTKLIGALAVAFLGLATAPAATAQIVRTEQGRFAGARHDGVVSFLGIPYAAAPVGELRWRPPQPAPRWRGVRTASEFAPACMQTGVSMPGEPPPRTSEDCLYLNIWTQSLRRRARAPVMVWIHGGGYTNGATALPLYRGDRLARRGVVVVSIAYRLGPLGFLAHPDLTAELGSSGNYALMDQIAALRWVHQNIAAFGGDPGNVTVFGQSAGAMSISLLMASPRARGLFHRAIAQSGGVFEPLQLAPHYLLANAEREGVEYASSLGADSIAALRRLPAERLLEGAARRVGHPVIEPAVLPMSPYDAYVSGLQVDIPVLMGSNAEEANSLVDLDQVTTQSFSDAIARAWGPLPPALLNAYPFTDDAGARIARAAFERDLRFGWDMWTWARFQARASQPAYYYRFSRRPPFPVGGLRERWGASHFAELWYMFDHLDREDWTWTAEDRRLADAMARYWVNFARTGNPNGEGLPRWPAFTHDDDGQMLDLGNVVGVRPAPVDPQLRVFDAVYDHIRGAPFGVRGRE